MVRDITCPNERCMMGRGGSLMSSSLRHHRSRRNSRQYRVTSALHVTQLQANEIFSISEPWLRV
jgi:hypothetical protein